MVVSLRIRGVNGAAYGAGLLQQVHVILGFGVVFRVFPVDIQACTIVIERVGIILFNHLFYHPDPNL